MTVLIYGYTLILLAGLGMAFLTYLAYRRFTKGKIICYFYTKNRWIYRKPIRPDPQNILHHKGRAYVYREELVIMTPGFLLREPTPSLVFEEDEVQPTSLEIPASFDEDSLKMTVADFIKKKVEPQSLHQKTPTRRKDSVSSVELSEILNDKTVEQFVAAQGKVSVGTLLMSQVIGFGLVLLALGIGAYYIVGLIGGNGSST